MARTSPYSKDAPLVASLSVNQKITGRNSEKDVRHIEIDLGDSGLRYQPGDALGHERRSLNNFHRDRVITFEQIAE